MRATNLLIAAGLGFALLGCGETTGPVPSDPVVVERAMSQSQHDSARTTLQHQSHVPDYAVAY